MPWLSLAAGIASAALMDRSPDRAWLVATAAGVMWVGLAALAVLVRREGSRSKLSAAARFSSFAATQSMTQVTLFFVLPFFWRAATPAAGHLVFVGALALAAGLTLWDPVFAALLARPALALPVMALSSFAGLAAALPALGLGHHVALWVAAGATALMGIVAPRVLAPPGDRSGTALSGVVTGLVLVGGLVAGGARIVPAAPLRLVTARMGTALANKTVAVPREKIRGRPARLVCATAVWAPLGLHDELWHVWRKDGQIVDRIPLEISGGRNGGFRTWSIKQNLGADPVGQWTCTVETRAGQHLGGPSVQLLARS